MGGIPQIVLALSLLWLVYAYFGYPAILYAFSQLRPRRPQRRKDLEPTVTVITAAFNEAAHIRHTLENKLALDYPVKKLNILVVSDESTDGTDEIVESVSLANPGRIRLIRQSPRQGKTAGLNLAVPQATARTGFDAL